VVANTVASASISPLPTVTRDPYYFGTFARKEELLSVSKVPKTFTFESPCTLVNSSFTYTLNASLPLWI